MTLVGAWALVINIATAKVAAPPETRGWTRSRLRRPLRAQLLVPTARSARPARSEAGMARGDEIGRGAGQVLLGESPGPLDKGAVLLIVAGIALSVFGSKHHPKQWWPPALARRRAHRTRAHWRLGGSTGPARGVHALHTPASAWLCAAVSSVAESSRQKNAVGKWNPPGSGLADSDAIRIDCVR